MDADEKIDSALAVVKENLKRLLTSRKAMGKYVISIEANVSQGTMGDIYILNNSREKL